MSGVTAITVSWKLQLARTVLPVTADRICTVTCCVEGVVAGSATKLMVPVLRPCPAQPSYVSMTRAAPSAVLCETSARKLAL